MPQFLFASVLNLMFFNLSAFVNKHPLIEYGQVVCV